MPLTALSTLIGSIVMLGTWFIISRRIRMGEGVSNQIQQLNKYFLYNGIFFLFMFLPHLALVIDEASFPVMMAWGYLISHVFLYISFIYIFKLLFSLVPRLANKMKWGIWFGVVMTVYITVLTFFTMNLGTLPAYDEANQITRFNVHPALGSSIGLFATVAILPTALLFIYNGFHNKAARTRSFLLGFGILIMYLGGPLHDVAPTWQVYVIADVLSITGTLIFAAGIIYRIEEKITYTKTVPANSEPVAG